MMRYPIPTWAVNQVVRRDRLDQCVEDICEHGVGHPNLSWVNGEKDAYAGVHGCDGCCRQQDEIVSERIPMQLHEENRASHDSTNLTFAEVNALYESNKIELEFQANRLLASIEAWLYLKGKDHLTERIIHDLHRIMMLPTDTIEDIDKGRWRRCEIIIAGHRGVSPKDLNVAMMMWFEQHGDAKTPEDIRDAHIAYEKIHPFADGNGRSGRMIMNWQLWKAGYPIAIIEAAKKRAYYGWFA